MKAVTSYADGGDEMVRCVSKRRENGWGQLALTKARIIVVLLLCAAALGCWSVAASAEAGPVGGSSSEPKPLSLKAPLFTHAQPPVATAPTPEQLNTDAQSRQAFAGLGQEAAVALARQDFQVETPGWTAPGQEDGGHIARYLGESSVVEALPSGKDVVVASTVPLRTEDSSGNKVPVSMSLQDRGEAYAPASPLVPVAISKTLSGGISFSSGISVAPAGEGAGEKPVLVGDRVIFSNAARDTDFMAEALPTGAEASWLMRSENSPREQSLTFHLPSGFSLRTSASTPGGAEVVDQEGKTHLLIPPASAMGADHAPVATTYQVAGDTLTTRVAVTATTDFPILVDPLLVGYYGSINSSGMWTAAGWYHSDDCGGCLNYLENALWVQVGGYPNAPESYGAWAITAPGAGQPGGAGIARVDIQGVNHWAENESNLVGNIEEDSGGSPVYSYNGLVGASGPLPLETPAFMSNKAIAFCAQGAGGHDGGEQPLCDENYSGQTFELGIDLFGGRTYYNYAEMSGAAVTFLDNTPPNEVHPVNFAGNEWPGTPWERTGPIHDYVTAHDAGLGIQRFELQIPPGNPPYVTQNLTCNEPNGFSGCPQNATSSEFNLSALTTGVYTVGAYATDAAGNRTQADGTTKLYIDRTAPVIPSFTGSLAQAINGEVGDGTYTLNFEAQDGSSASPQAGMESVEIFVDGTRRYELKTPCPKPTGIPTTNCFGLSGSWQFSGQDYGVGTHTIDVYATDWAKNSSHRTITVTVVEAAYQSLGPGSVNLTTGDYALKPTDFSIPAGGASLSVSRAFDSRYPTRGSGEPLGPGWTLALPDKGIAAWQSLTPLPNGSVSIRSAGGSEVVFTVSGANYVSPAGYQTYTLTKPTGTPVTYKLADAQGDITTFEQPTGGGPFVPKSLTQAGGTTGLNKVNYTFTTTTGGITEPTQMLAPEPVGVSCTSSFVKGCRALTFNYATSTTATGEKSSQWGDYTGHLTRVYLHAWNPETSSITETAVAQYAYDTKGRLRAEWDPRVSPVLKASYGYDSEGRVVAETPAGEETWAFTYGSTATDSNPGRLLAVTRPNAATSLWSGEAPVNVFKPTISGSPIVGVKMSVTNGTWGYSPVTYAYQWFDCRTAGGECCSSPPVVECSQIPGASNPTYTPTASDVGHPLAVKVFAINGSGSVESITTLTTAVQSSGTPHEGEAPPATAPRSTVEYGVPLSGSGLETMTRTEVERWGQTDVPTGATAIFPPDEVVSWPAADYRRASIYYLDSINRTVNVAQPGGRISTTEYDSHYNIIRTLTPANRQTALEAGSGSAAKSRLLDTESTYNAAEPAKNLLAGAELTDVTGPQHTVKLASGSQVETREHSHYTYDQGAPSGGPYYLVTGSTEGPLTGGTEADVRTSSTSYAGQSNLGWKLHAPTSATTDPTGLALTSTTKYDETTGNVLETTSPAGAEKSEVENYNLKFGSYGSGEGQLETPEGVAIDPRNNNVYVADYAMNRVEKFSPSGSFLGWVGSATSGSGEGQLSHPEAVAVNSAGNVYVADAGNHRVEEFNTEAHYVRAWGTEGTTEGKFGNAMYGLTFDANGKLWVTDGANHRVQEFSETGTFERKFGEQGTSEGKFEEPRGITVSAGNLYVTDFTNSRVEEFNLEGHFVKQFGSYGLEAGQLRNPWGITADSKGDIYVVDWWPDLVEEFTPAGKFIAWIGAEGTGAGQLEDPDGIASNSAGGLYIPSWDYHTVSEWVPGNQHAHTTQAIYYTAGANSTYPACGNHPEWAALPCQTQPVAQPGTSGLPNLPVTTYTYNLWDEPLTTTDTSGASTRTTTFTYDSAGRIHTSAITASTGVALPTVTDKYNSTLGSLEELSTTVGGVTTKITSVMNKLGQTTSYTDADGNTSTFSFDVDGRPETISDGKGTQTSSYDTTTGLLTRLVDSAAGTFTASYNANGNLVNEGLPNGMSVKTSYNAANEPVAREDIKTTHCTTGCTWFSDGVVPSIHAQWLEQASTLSHQAYGYDNAGRLTEVQDTPAAAGCTTRIYTYDEDTNRANLATRAPGTGGACATGGGLSETHTYDTADRLTDYGTTYDPWGNITKLPAIDAAGNELTSTYYTSNKLATQSQHGETITYNQDPSLRTREIVSTGTTSSDVINHYGGTGDSPAWTVETPSGHWTRYISGIGNGLAAIQNNGETPVLQLSNLHGDIIATVPLSETATGLASSTDTTEYGVPRTSIPPKYSWLGAAERSTELPSGVIAMGARSYVPQIGRFLQTDPVPGGSANAYAYTMGDPVNSADPSGEYTSTTTYGELSNVSTGPGVTLPSGHDIVPGALMPPPVNTQIEEAFNANPPWPSAAELLKQEEEAREAEETQAMNEYLSQFSSSIGGNTSRRSIVTYKGGPGATCGSNSRSHRKCPDHWRGGEGGPTVGEVVGWLKEAYGIGNCVYELATLKGACPRP